MIRTRNAMLLVLSTCLLNIFVAFIATKIIVYKGLFSFPEILNRVPLPDFLQRFASFDGIHYIKIATLWYQETSRAFFPLYPGIMKIVGLFTKLPYGIAGMIISIAALCGFTIVFSKYLLELKLTKKQVWWSAIFFLAFPTAFFLQAVYTESLFLFLTIVTLYLARKERYVLAALVGLLAPFARLMGLFLFVPLLFEFLRTKNKKALIAAAMPVVGFVAYLVFLKLQTGNYLAFLSAQDTFENGRTTQFVLLPQVLFRYLKIFFSADYSFAYAVSLFEFCTFLFVFVFLCFELWHLVKVKFDYSRAGLLAFSCINILLPTLTGTFLSVPRFALVSLSLFIVLGTLKSTIIKGIILALFIFVHIWALMYFIQGYFVS